MADLKPTMREIFEMTTKQAEPDLDSWTDQERRQRRAGRRRKVGAIVVAAAIAIAAVVVVVLANDDRAPTQPLEDPTQAGVVPQNELPTAIGLNGVWLQIGDPAWPGVLMSFRPDGTFTLDDAGDLTTEPLASGTFTVTDDEISFTTVGPGPCIEGDGWTWQASIPETGLIEAEYTEEGTGACRTPMGTGWTLTRISPAAASIQAIFGPGTTDLLPAQGPAPTPRETAGIWLTVDDVGATSLLIQFHADGRFSMDDGGGIVGDPSLTGSVELDGNAMTFEVLGGGACPGETFTWEASLPEDGLLRVRHTETASMPECFVDVGTEWTLIRISPGSPAGDRLIAGA